MSWTPGWRANATSGKVPKARKRLWADRTRSPASPWRGSGWRLTPGRSLLVFNYGQFVFFLLILWWLADQLMRNGESALSPLLIFVLAICLAYRAVELLLRTHVYGVSWKDGRLFLRNRFGRRVEQEITEVVRITPPNRPELVHVLVFHDGTSFPLLGGFDGLDDLLSAIGKRPGLPA
ncbi:hypothetical protein [Oceanicella sp. SM1341]|uniref:hypothetical protein n=1 Tax=Oceanicella sp. SM1341 TaxID=1548889 RepID=UPI00130079B8|nr:hypothetical protein [Oceanicella sp. SM1341]